jgi:phosphoglycolate phosphatase
MDLVLFDLDGTLINSARIILDSQRFTAAAHGLVHPGEAEGFGIVGLSLDLALAQLFGPTVPAAELSETYKRIFNELRATPGYEEPLFDGVAEMLAALQGREGTRLGMATGKTRRGVDHVLDLQGWRELFVTLQNADTAPSKPHPAMIEQGMAEAGSTPARTVMIGDSVHDMAMAKAAGVAAIGVAWGFQPAAMLREAGADLIVDHARDLPHAITRSLSR